MRVRLSHASAISFVSADLTVGNWLQFEIWLQLEPDLLRQPLGGRTLRGTDDVCIVIEGHLRIAMSHQSGDDVYRCSGFEQLGRYTMPEAMNSNMDSFFGLDAELCDRTVYSVLDHIVSERRN